MQDAASAKSEMTAIYQYLYQHWFLRDQHRDLSRLLMGISKVEMMHLDILGELVVLLGGNPKSQAVCDNRCVYWHGGMVNYSTDVRSMLLADLAAEQAAVERYTLHSNIIKDPYVAAVLGILAEDEKVHVRLFTEYLATL